MLSYPQSFFSQLLSPHDPTASPGGQKREYIGQYIHREKRLPWNTGLASLSQTFHFHSEKGDGVPGVISI